ncbi:MAG: teichoic acid glycosylation protein [Firmicutes bacterium HGW-Firmicutes-21]|nr:MAG: teichoic acid glycosylation protein [Firmicutes bacterium HGW-Firmicutes-21]
MKKLYSILKSVWSFLFKTEKGLYLVFGGLTTLVSIITFWICDKAFGGEQINLSTVIKNVAGIIFAYFTNRIFVFKSENRTGKAKTQEFLLFAFTRAGTLLLDLWLINLLVEKAHMNQNIGTIITSVIVIVLNYIASKLYIFKRKD